jgi:hypothetical protein
MPRSDSLEVTITHNIGNADDTAVLFARRLIALDWGRNRRSPLSETTMPLQRSPVARPLVIEAILNQCQIARAQRSWRSQTIAAALWQRWRSRTARHATGAKSVTSCENFTSVLGVCTGIVIASSLFKKSEMSGGRSAFKTAASIVGKVPSTWVPYP